jgi:hypothetical protein
MEAQGPLLATAEANLARGNRQPSRPPSGQEKPASPDDLLASTEVGALLGISRRTLTVWICTGQVTQPLRINRRVIRWKRGDLSL